MARSKVPNPSQHIMAFPAGAEGAGKRSRREEPAAVRLDGEERRLDIPKARTFTLQVEGSRLRP
jgi:hypothetical protein